MSTQPTPAQAPHRFTSASASAAGKRSAETRRAKSVARAAEPTELARRLAEFRTTFGTTDLSADVLTVAGVLLARLASGEIPVRNGGEAADLLRALHEIARLEAGQPTSLSATVTIDQAQAVARLAELQTRARQTLTALPSATAQAADDVQVVDTPPPVVVVVEQDPAPPGVESPVRLEGATPHPR